MVVSTIATVGGGRREEGGGRREEGGGRRKEEEGVGGVFPFPFLCLVAWWYRPLV
jgi:hypothetical protein